MIELDATVFVQAVFFLVLWAVLARLLFKPLMTLLAEREKRTEGVRAQAQSLLEEAKRLQAEYEKGITEAREAGESQKEAIRREAAASSQRLIAQGREEAARLAEQVRGEIQQELERARAAAATEAEQIGRQMVEKILGRKVA